MTYSITQDNETSIHAISEANVRLFLRPEEDDHQELYENNNFHKALAPEDFTTDRGGWWYRCRTCGGQTKLRTKHPYCRHCGFSQNSL